MTNPTPLEVAHALRSAAAFCRDPNSPKWTVGQQGYAGDAAGRTTVPGRGDAVSWCAIGWAHELLGTNVISTTLLTLGTEGAITTAFDAGHYDTAAHLLSVAATEIEAGIPTQQPAEQREQVTA